MLPTALINAAFDAYHASPAEVRVNPSIPILYFGDLDAYELSAVRIITVGLNPSNAEFYQPPTKFPRHARWDRFPGAPALLGMAPSNARRDLYCAELNEYFRVDPYRRWFAHPNALLHGFGASFYGGPDMSTALHTDLMTPVATSATWGVLDIGVQGPLRAYGLRIWEELVVYLQPELILISVAEHYLDDITLALTHRRVTLPDVPGNHGNVPFKHQRHRLPHGGHVDVVFERNLRGIPFGWVKDKRAAGPVIRQRVAARV